MVRLDASGGPAIRGLWRPSRSNVSHGAAVRPGEPVVSTIVGGTTVACRRLDAGPSAMFQDLAPHRQPCALTPDDSVGAVDAAVAGRGLPKCSAFSNGGLPKYRFVDPWTP